VIVEVVFLGVVARKGIANAAIAPTKAPKMAKPTFWDVYENAIPAKLIVWSEPIAKAPFVAKSERRKLGTTIPAMNKVNTTSISSRTSKRAFCLFMLLPSSPSADFPKGEQSFVSRYPDAHCSAAVAVVRCSISSELVR
jgi:hypothetical protein